jgi:aarF domain-containing kinase
MLKVHRRAGSLVSGRLIAQRAQHSASSSRSEKSASIQEHASTPASAGSSTPVQPTGAAKILADAIAEEASESLGSTLNNARDHLRLTQGPIWDGDETTPDAVLRMLVDANKPLRSGSGVKHNAADEKIKGWMKGLKLEPRLGGSVTGVAANDVIAAETPEVNPHRTTIPPHLHRPWHSTYAGASQVEEAPKIKYGTFIKKTASGDDLTNLLELQLPPGADGKTRARVKEARRAGKVVRRFETARDGALDYKLGIASPTQGSKLVAMDAADDDDTFMGNRQIKGSSALGGGKGMASGMRAWAGLAEDRIEVSFIQAVFGSY